MTTSQYAELTLQEKEAFWVKAIEQKCGEDGAPDMTEDQWDYELEYHVLYEDDVLTFAHHYVTELVISRDDENGVHHGVAACWEVFKDKELGDLGNILQLESLRGMTIIDYMRTKDFPLTFPVWL